MPGNCGSSSSAFEISPEDRKNSNTSAVLVPARLDVALYGDNRWGPWIFDTFGGRSFDGSWTSWWLAQWLQMCSSNRFVHFTRYLWPDPRPIRTQSAIAVENSAPKVSTIFFFFTAPTPVLWIGSPSFHVFSAIAKLLTAGESAGSALSDAIQCDGTVECNQSDIEVFLWPLGRPKHVIWPLARPPAVQGLKFTIYIRYISGYYISRFVPVLFLRYVWNIQGVRRCQCQVLLWCLQAWSISDDCRMLKGEDCIQHILL